MIMSKQRTTGRSATGGKRQRKSITLEKKLDVIKIYKCNEHMVYTANPMGIPESTLKTIK
jgi:hypothetical protein